MTTLFFLLIWVGKPLCRSWRKSSGKECAERVARQKDCCSVSSFSFCTNQANLLFVPPISATNIFFAVMLEKIGTSLKAFSLFLFMLTGFEHVQALRSKQNRCPAAFLGVMWQYFWGKLIFLIAVFLSCNL